MLAQYAPSCVLRDRRSSRCPHQKSTCAACHLSAFSNTPKYRQHPSPRGRSWESRYAVFICSTTGSSMTSSSSPFAHDTAQRQTTTASIRQTARSILLSISNPPSFSSRDKAEPAYVKGTSATPPFEIQSESSASIRSITSSRSAFFFLSRISS